MDPVQVLTLLAKMYDEQAVDEENAAYYQGAASACRVALQILVPMNGTKGSRTRAVTKAVKAARGSGKTAAPEATAAAPGPGEGYVCPECGREYRLPQHLGMHRKRSHGVPSMRDLGEGKVTAKAAKATKATRTGKRR